ncbi:cold-shock protein [Colwellia sp. 75C3]|uniref:cold shock domain-containing protein n=1 Tax=Colwellia sp. 75C3 TaxID=888425 RepID=UPI000C33D475|nr:cold shock domain-containing protein [Colwellia sp. 75C3]PKG85744.1 cold-shock protein [Colwellia sp. 75C3]
MHKGQLKKWNDAKGFGFIQSTDVGSDIFVHISALKNMSRKPKVGDFIYFEVEKQADEKTRATNCRIEGVLARTKKVKKHRVERTTQTKSKLISLLIVIAISAFAYQRVNTQISNAPTGTNVAKPTPKTSSSSKVQFQCDGRQYCSQMTSRAEAVFFIRHCPNTKMDGDNDGIPCENDSRF